MCDIILKLTRPVPSAAMDAMGARMGIRAAGMVNLLKGLDSFIARAATLEVRALDLGEKALTQLTIARRTAKTLILQGVQGKS